VLHLQAAVLVDFRLVMVLLAVLVVAVLVRLELAAQEQQIKVMQVVLVQRHSLQVAAVAVQELLAVLLAQMLVMVVTEFPLL
jgi:hypothetical protein